MPPAVAHALAGRVCWKPFQILDTGDQQAALKRLIKAMGVDEERFPARDMMHYINALKEQGIRAGQAEGA